MTVKMEKWNPLLQSYPDSEKINAVSIGAETLYTRLLAACDDKGHYYGEPFFILSKLFTSRASKSQVTIKMAEEWIKELEKEGLIYLYKIGNSIYLEVINCKKHLRKDIKPDIRFPDSPKSLKNKARTESVTDALRMRNENVPTDTYTDTNTNADAGATPQQIFEPKKQQPTSYDEAARHLKDLIDLHNAKGLNIVLPPSPEIVEERLGNIPMAWILGCTLDDLEVAIREWRSKVDEHNRKRPQGRAPSFGIGYLNGVLLAKENRRLDADRKQERQDAAKNTMAIKLAETKKIDDEAQLMRQEWSKLPLDEKKRLMAADKANYSFANEATTMARWWKERNKQCGNSGK